MRHLFGILVIASYVCVIKRKCMKLFFVTRKGFNYVVVKAENVESAFKAARLYWGANCWTLGIEHSFDYEEGDKYDIG